MVLQVLGLPSATTVNPVNSLDSQFITNQCQVKIFTLEPGRVMIGDMGAVGPSAIAAGGDELDMPGVSQVNHPAKCRAVIDLLINFGWRGWNMGCHGQCGGAAANGVRPDNHVLPGWKLPQRMAEADFVNIAPAPVVTAGLVQLLHNCRDVLADHGLEQGAMGQPG